MPSPLLRLLITLMPIGRTDPDKLADFDNKLDTASQVDEDAQRRDHQAFLPR
jgi:hypothetical protein